MRILAVDTSCDESCAAIVDTTTGRLLADVVHTHVSQMAKFGGVVPEIASREHMKGLPLAVQEALDQAGLQFSDLDWLTVTHRPGLIGALLVGVSYIKALAFALQKPFSVLNHIEAHLFSPFLALSEGLQPPPFPWIALVVSGGHTELFLVKGIADFQWLGGTLDDAAGEAFDKAGKLLSLPYPAGPVIDEMVRTSATDEHRKRFRFPRAALAGLQLSFSGLKTAVSLQIKKMGVLSDDDKLAVAASTQEAIIDALVNKLRSAQKEFGPAALVVTGGVACNSRLRERLPEAYFPKPKHCTDNAAMVAILSALHAREKKLHTAEWSVGPIAHADF